jgi:EAL and modified HD-GYP domain-containing signal transduction protein
VTLLRLLRALNDPDLSIGELEDLVKHDAAMCYRILRAVNSAALARRTEVESMHDALLLLGRDVVRPLGVHLDGGRAWRVRAQRADRHVHRSGAVVRVAAGTAPGGVSAGEAFLLGMCSLFDTILGRPMVELVNELPLGIDTKRALAGQPTPARTILDCVIAYEHGAWDQCEALARQARVNPAVMPGAFLEAIRWAGELAGEEGRSSRFEVRSSSFEVRN